MLFILFGTCLVWSANKALLLNDACWIVEGTTGDKAFLARSTLNVENQAVSWELLPTLDSQDVARLRVCPSNWQESFDLPCNHQIFYLLIIDFIGDLSLSQFKSEISHAHQTKIDRQCNNGKGVWDLIVVLRLENQKEQNNCKNVLKMRNCINNEIP